MTTTSSSTATSSGSAILTALDAGSGINTSTLVSGLVSATYDPKDAALKAKETINTAKISSLGTLTGKIDAFATALGTLVSGGTLFTQPTSSDSSILTATAKPGSAIGTLSAQVEVRQTAQAQSLVSPYLANAGAAVGQGKLTINTGSSSFTVTIGPGNDSLSGLARAINTTASGVTASVVTDANGARLTLKGKSGAASAFTVTAAPDSAAGLARFAFGGTAMTLSGTTVTSGALADASSAPVGQGDLTLTTANGTRTLTIDGSNDNLTGLAASINGAGLGVTASVTTDANGSYLVVSDGNGGTPSFTLSPAAGAQAGLARFAYGSATTQMSRAQTAQDAIIRMDGVDITRTSNTVSDLIDGVTLNLAAAQPGTTVTLGSTRPTAALSQAVSDFVAAYNDMKTDMDTATASPLKSADGTAGPLYGNASIRQMQRQLSRLSSTVLNSGGGPQTLAEIGVTTNPNDGSLMVDQARLTATLNTYPDAVEAMFNPTQHSDNPLVKITSAMGAAKPGTYAITGVTAGTDQVSAQGMIAGMAAITTGTSLYAASKSDASGLVIQPQGDFASATVTVDLGLGGALQAIRDSLRASGGVLTSLSTQLTTEKSSLATQRTKMESDETSYSDRLTKQFATMQTRVSNFKSIQSYLTQQIAVWTNKSD